MPIGDRPIMDVIVRQLQSAGVSRITVATGYLAELIEVFFGNGSKYGVPIDYFREDEPLGTVGALALIGGFDSGFLVMNGDVLTDLDYARLFEDHCASDAVATIATRKREVEISSRRVASRRVARDLEAGASRRPRAGGILRRMAVHSTPEIIREVLTETHTWAVIGCSPDPRRDSNRIARLLQSHGYRVIPVNPNATAQELLGERCYGSLADIPASEHADVVDIFRRADYAGAHVDEAVAAGAHAVWMQLGVIDEAAAHRALGAGLQVVMNRCPAFELPRLAA